MLRKAGYRVLEAGNGAEALTVLKARQDQSPVDVILCDIRMPEMDGSQAIPAFREQYPSVPVVVLTGFPDAEMATMLLRQGVSDYTPKPIEQEKLLAVIQKAMEQRMAMITSTFKV
jgi:two-component system chemotaxis response regulator CheY